MNIKKLLFIPALFFAVATFGQSVDLTFKPIPNKKYALEVNSTMNMVQNMSGMEMEIKVSSVGKAKMEIEKVESNGDFSVLFTWDEISANSSAMGQDTTIRFDNLNLKMRTTYNNKGKILENEVLTQASGVAGNMVSQLATGVKLQSLPGKKTDKGAKWTVQTNDTISAMGSPFPIATTFEEGYTFVGKETKEGKEYYRINSSGPMEISAEIAQMGMNMTMEGSGMSDAYSLHDKTTLFPVYVETKVGIDMSMVITGGQNMAIPITQNTVATVKFIEIK